MVTQYHSKKHHLQTMQKTQNTVKDRVDYTHTILHIQYLYKYEERTAKGETLIYVGEGVVS